jgi:hypothetical protein
MNEWDCVPLDCAGLRCPRPAEVRAYLVDTDGSTRSQSAVCAVHGFQAAAMAFTDTTTARQPCTVILAPL